jgi:Tn3 transposase DDE domain
LCPSLSIPLWNSVYLWAFIPPQSIAVSRRLSVPFRTDRFCPWQICLASAPAAARREALTLMSGALSLLANAVIAYDTWKLDEHIQAWELSGRTMPSPDILAHIAPVAFGHINFGRVYRFPIERHAGRLVPSMPAALVKRRNYPSPVHRERHSRPKPVRGSACRALVSPASHSLGLLARAAH